MLGKVGDCPLQLEDISERKNQIIVDFEAAAHESEQDSLDRGDIPIDFGFVDLLLRVVGGRSGPFLSPEELEWHLEPECHALLRSFHRRKSGDWLNKPTTWKSFNQ